MLRSRAFMASVYASLAVTIGAMGCGPGDIGSRVAGGFSNGPGDLGPGATGEGSGGSAGGIPGPGQVGTDADTSARLTLACPTGFVVCNGVCLEGSLMGADCHPRACAAPPAGTTPPTRAGGVTARGFDWNVTSDANGTSVTFKPGKGGGSLAPTIAVDLNYRVNDKPQLLTAALKDPGDGTFRWQTADVKKGDNLDFYFHQTVAPQTIILPGPGGKPLIDTMWFH